MLFSFVRHRSVVIMSATLLALSVVTACSSSAKKPVYDGAEEAEGLVVPPDLVMPQDQGTDIPNTASQYASLSGTGPAQQATRPAGSPVPEQFPTGIKMGRDGALRWLVINTSSDQVWEKLKGFLTKQGFELVVDNRKLGYVETNWQDPGQSQSGNWFTRMVGNVSSSGMLDRYRVRLETDERGLTLMFVAHHGRRELVSGEDTDQAVSDGWTWRPADPQLEVEMMQRFAIYLGVDEATALAAIPAVVPTDGLAHIVDRENDLWLQVDQVYYRAWRRTQIALDRLGLIIEQRDRKTGEFLVKVPEDFIQANEGMLSSFFGGKKPTGDQSFIVKLSADGKITRLELRDSEGNLRRGDLERRVLGRLQQLLS